MTRLRCQIRCLGCVRRRFPMGHRNAPAGNPRDTQLGFTLLELVVVIGIVAVMTVLALPSINSWRNSLNYRMTAKSMQHMLREARAMSIANNLQYMVVFKPNSSSYKIIKGNQAYNTTSSGYTAVVQQMVAPSSIIVRTGPKDTSNSTANVYVQFNPNGTATISAPDKTACDSYVYVNDKTGPIYSVNVISTGRIALAKK